MNHTVATSQLTLVNAQSQASGGKAWAALQSHKLIAIGSDCDAPLQL
jgi:hypothetical protein